MGMNTNAKEIMRDKEGGVMKRFSEPVIATILVWIGQYSGVIETGAESVIIFLLSVIAIGVLDRPKPTTGGRVNGR